MFKKEFIYVGTDHLHFIRWIIFHSKNFAIYLHKFVGDDTARALHDHPKRFISIGLWGHYDEEVPEKGWVPEGGAPFSTERNLFLAPWIRSFRPTHIHRIRNCVGCWSLVFVFSRDREWGFWRNNQTWVQWEQYLREENMLLGGKHE
jgi:hypothetical protein